LVVMSPVYTWSVQRFGTSSPLSQVNSDALTNNKRKNPLLK
jgi:hypothetical protein